VPDSGLIPSSPRLHQARMASAHLPEAVLQDGRKNRTAPNSVTSATQSSGSISICGPSSMVWEKIVSLMTFIAD
jgi:hypothetical protein